MKVTVNKKEFERKLIKVSKLASPKSSRPVLRTVKLDVTKDGQGFLHATNLETHLSLNLTKLNVFQSGVVLIDPVLVKKYLKLIKDEQILIQKTDKVIFKDSKGETTFEVEDEEMFPQFPSVPPVSPITITADKIRAIQDKVVWACAKEKGRYVLNGVLFKAREGSLDVAGTDGARLSLLENVTSVQNREFDICVHKSVIKLLKELKVDAKMYFPTTTVDSAFHWVVADLGDGDGKWASLILEGVYPNYPEIFPKTTARKMTYNTKELLSAVERSKLTASERSFTCVLDSDRLISQSPDIGKTEVNLTFKGDHRTAEFNIEYLSQYLKVVESSKVQITFQEDKKSPYMFEEIEPKTLLTKSNETKFIHLISPVVKD